MSVNLLLTGFQHLGTAYNFAPELILWSICSHEIPVRKFQSKL